MITKYEQTQQAVERILAYVDSLIEQGKSRSEATDHASQRFGCLRHTVVRILNDRDYGLLGTSGEPVYGCAASPQGLMGTA